MLYLGIDCGTQGTKAVLVDPNDPRMIVGRGYAPHALIAEASGRREQKTEWWTAALEQAVLQAVRESGRPASDVAAIAVSGQHHGLVMLDEAGAVLRDVKLWNDTETAAENELLVQKAGGLEGIWSLIGTTLPVGYTASKVAWVRRHEPETYAKLRHVLLPHDYLNYWLTGELVMEAGEASGTGFFNVVERTWSERMIGLIDPDGILRKAIPRLASPLDPIGTVQRTIAERFGFRPNTLVACGSGDNVMGAVGTGNVRHGRATLGLGTSGVINVFSEHPVPDLDRNLQVFCGVDGGWIPTTATMNATSSTSLFQSLFEVGVQDIEALIAAAKPGADGVRMVPFFNGERIPPLPRARAAMHGLSFDNVNRSNLMRAAAEAVAFVLMFGYRKLPGHSDVRRTLRLTGGGANSPAWRQIIADVFDADAIRVKWDEGGAFGAALLALTVELRASGTTTSLAEVCDHYVELDEEKAAHPIADNVRIYRELFGEFLETLQREYGVSA